MVGQSFLLAGLLLAGSAIAQDSSATRSGAASASTNLAGPDGNKVSVQVVQVSDMNATLKYYPEDIKAEPGSMVQFQFYPKNHTVTQSTFDKPCIPINTVMSNVTGVNSGPMPPENGMMKVFTIMVNDTKPIWMYCATKGHCQKGMAMVINAPSSGTKTLAAYKEAAAKTATATGNATNSTGSTGTGTGKGTGTGTGYGAGGNNSTNGTSGGAKSGASSVVRSMAGSTGIAALVVAALAFVL